MVHIPATKSTPKRDESPRTKYPKDYSNYPPPDGGYGYLVAFACTMITFLNDGVGNSFGILMPLLIEDLGSSVSVTSVAPGLRMAMFMFTGPLAAYLVRKFGCRRVSIVGSIVASASVVMATLAKRIEVFVLFYGFTAGFGMGLVYLPSVTMINAYFDRKRGLFAGIVTSGSGIGLLVISLLIDILIGEYGWRGCYLIIAGILLNLCVCASLMRPLADNYRFKSGTSTSADSFFTPVSKISQDDQKVPTNRKDLQVVSDWVASQPLLPSQQTKGDPKINSLQPCMSKNSPVAKFTSLQKLSVEGQDLGRPPCKKDKDQGDFERLHTGKTYELSQSLKARLDCGSQTFQQVKSSHTTDDGYDDTTLDPGNIDGDGENILNGNARIDTNESDLTKSDFHQNYQVITNNDTEGKSAKPEIVVNGDILHQTKPTTECMHYEPCSKPDMSLSGNDQTSTASYSNDCTTDFSLQNDMYESNTHYLHNQNNHNHHHQRVHHHNNYLNHHLHPHHLHHQHHHKDLCIRDSHSTLHDTVETDSVNSGRPTFHKSDLLNILPEFIGSLSSLSVNTVHSAHSARYRGSQRSLRSSLLHQRASAYHLNGPGDSHASLSLGSKHTLPGSLILDVPVKDLGDEEVDDGLQQVETYSSCDLFKIVRFDLFCVGAFLVQVAFIIPTMFVPSYVVSAGFSTSTAATLVSILGISNTAGRLMAGFLSFLGLGTVRIYNSGTFLAGIACFLLPLCSTFPTLVAFAVCHGFFIGFFPPLQSVILVEQLGLERLPSSFGIMCVCKSVASVSGPFFAGALYEWAQNYAVPFYFAGSTMMLANIVHCVMSFCPKPDFAVI